MLGSRRKTEGTQSRAWDGGFDGQDVGVGKQREGHGKFVTDFGEGDTAGSSQRG